MYTSRKLPMLAPVLALAALALPAAAFGQATRTWVSGVGDDANPCSRTAPCKTLAGAISKTAAKGEINVLDPGGVGTLTITKSITVRGYPFNAGVLTNVNNAFIVNAASTDKVTIAGFDINGLGTALSGVRILSAKNVVIKDNDIYEFARNGIEVVTNSPNTKVVITNNHIHDVAGVGIMNAPTTAGSNARVTAKKNDIEDNGCGVASTTFGVDTAFNYSVNCGTASSATGVQGRSVTNLFRNSITDNVNAGVLSRGNLSALIQAVVRIGNNEITGNTTGLQPVEGGQIVTFGNNLIDGNASTNPPTGSVLPAKRLPKR
jgi:hypothetical protein